MKTLSLIILTAFTQILYFKIHIKRCIPKTIRTDNSMKDTIKYLPLNQACVDILISLIEVLNIVHYNSYHSKWFGGIGGLITCKLFQASFFILPAFSIWILVLIAIERYYAVVRPFQSSPISNHLKKNIVLPWAWSFSSATSL